MIDLFPYQETGAQWLAGRERALLADGMGLGKSAQAIAACDLVGAKSVVVICPAVARTNWRREFDKFSATKPKLYVESFDKVALSAPVREDIKRAAPDVLIIDEAHYLKTRTSKRTKTLYGPYCRGDGLAKIAKRVWLLTGTPAPNDVSELFTHWRALFGYEGNFISWVERFTRYEATPFGLKILGNKSTDELRSMLRAHILRRRAEEVLTELPPIMWSDIELEARHVGDLQHLEDEPAVMKLRQQLALDNIPQELEVAMASLRRVTGEAKAKAAVDMLAEELKSGACDKVVVFAQHKAVIAELTKGLAEFGAVAISGETPPAKRQENIDTFNNSLGCRVFVGQLQACNAAINLQAANQVVFVESSWTPAENAQAAKRCHRIGQTRPVFVRVIGLAGTLDAAIASVLRRKSQNLAVIEV